MAQHRDPDHQLHHQNRYRTPGGHPRIVEKNVKLSMACHNGVHSPMFEDDHRVLLMVFMSFYLLEKRRRVGCIKREGRSLTMLVKKFC